MKENYADLALKEVKRRMGLVKNTLQKEFKGTKKFHQEPVPKKEQMLTYSGLSQQDIAYGLESQTQFYQVKITNFLQQYPPEQWQSVLSQMYQPYELAEQDMNEFIYENEKLLQGGK